MNATIRTKTDRIYQNLLNQIVGGSWHLGDQITPEEKLAVQFGCSRMTVNKAIGRLQHDGLVERRTRAGTRVIKNVIRHESAVPPQFDAVALIHPGEQHEGIWRIVQGFQQNAQGVQRRTMMLTYGTNFQKEAEMVGRLREFDVKGAVVYPVLPEPANQIYFGQMLLACRFPVVLVDVNLPGFGRPAVVADGFHAGYTMTRHLLAGGAKRIGFLSNYSWTSFMRDRYLGYRRAMEEAGILPPDNWILLESAMHPDFSAPVNKSKLLATRYLNQAADLEGLVCANDFLALGCLEAARDLNIAVPERLRVVGIDDYTAAAEARPALTTYHIPYTQMGRAAFDVLNGLLQGTVVPATELQLRGELVARQSG
ncbi:MAG: GntR family transcriptional regulator [Phycisphaerae bacterium]|nr:GntR family transcriptional regulator [Phycisphaerae bacterium]